MLDKIRAIRSLCDQLEKELSALQSAFSGSMTSLQPNKRGWIKCPQCQQSHRKGHPHLK